MHYALHTRVKHHKYPWASFAAGITKVNYLALSAHACETSVTDQMHLNKELFLFLLSF